MEQVSANFKHLISNSRKILITSHISPDADAVTSVLLLGLSFIKNYPSKQIDIVLEEQPEGLDFINGYAEIIFKPLLAFIKAEKPDLLIVLDGNKYERFSRHDGEEIRHLVSSNHITTVAIDHHEMAGADKFDILMNRQSPSTVQDVYELVVKQLKLKPPANFSQLTMTGIYSDTGGLVYVKDGQHRRLFDLVEELIEAGAKIEHIKNNLSKYTKDDMLILSQLLNNLSQQSDFTYSYLDDNFLNRWYKAGKTFAQTQKGTGIFLDNYVRHIENSQWGFIVYLNPIQGNNYYSVSFRSVNRVKDVARLAALLGGGGHKSAAGAKIKAENIKQAVQTVIDIIH